MIMRRRRFVLAVFVALLGFCISVGLSACGNQPRQAASDQSRGKGPVLDQIPVLSNAHPCAATAASTTAPGSDGGPATGPAGGPGGASFSCATLTLPLDHAGLHPGPKLAEQVSLQVAMADNADAPRGVLVFLTGGPGQPGVPFATLVASRLLDPAVVRDYRLVLIDQRGTGGGALQCPQLQQAMGSSDLTVPPAGAVAACAQAIGERRQFFTTADTVADLDELRRALGVDKLSFDGVSYGTFVAERYAVTHPDRVSRLVLDSIVSHDNLDPLAARAPQGHLVVIPGSGHSTQSSDNGPMGRAAVTAFLTGP